MISVSQAVQLITDHCMPTEPVRATLSEAAGLVLAADVVSPIDLPPFKQSGMDGYAFRFQDLPPHTTLTVTGVIAAGDSSPRAIQQGQAARIFTGAPLPENADTVVMQEKISLEGDQLRILQTDLAKGDHTRLPGAEVRSGTVALQKGVVLGPAAIGFLAGMGITSVLVFKKPVVSLIITGNELTQPGNALPFGQVYEASSFALRAAFRNLPAVLSEAVYVPDDPERIRETLKEALHASDIVLLTGGVSVGDFDFVTNAAEEAGVTRLFHRVKQKPGKPLFAGKIGAKVVFGLPGNPSSVLTCFYRYVVPAIERLTGRGQLLITLTVPFTGDYHKNAGMTHFLKGSFRNGTASVLTAQESYRLSSFAHANCLICAEEHREHYQTGDMVEIYLLPD
ncbi:molybdopterin molybdotransferase MoeA [Hufsiella ginkgonis]|uniref:Molybdopterin molybdenumtransferase n=1 Tax=Hufsiella ginkgonis TaxID=2695274 RepID=A0A7K1XZ15_9SPHI|nr:gephyrin-like molybdotransferase Glp [Hufsiella ginkgonis]MXV16068.1 molybdopterin molybdenumtransferase MoeA [Hufsiella ginkgonis]